MVGIFQGTPQPPPRRPSGQALLRRQAERESNARTYPRGMPMAVARAQGTEVFSVEGRRYLDFFAGAGVLALGHNHPRVQAAVRDQLDDLVHALDFPTPTRDRFVTALLSTLPADMRDNMRVHLCSPTGSDAIEAAVKLCKRATGRQSVVAFTGGYHGMTAGALALTSLRDVKARTPGLMPDVHFSPYAYCGRCPMGLSRTSCNVACGSLLENTVADAHSGVPLPAAVVMEMVQGEGGTIVPDAAFVTQVRRATAESEVPLVADEIQAGFGRTGRFYAFEHFGVRPDVITVSKALGGIGLPIAAILYRKELDVWEPGTHIGTFRGHQLAMAAGLAAMDVFEEEGILENTRVRGAELLAGLRDLDSPWLREVRGLGLMLGIELAHPETGAPAAAAAGALRDACFERGLLCELGGRQDATLRLLPPLNVSASEVQEAMAIITASLRTLPPPS